MNKIRKIMLSILSLSLLSSAEFSSAGEKGTFDNTAAMQDVNTVRARGELAKHGFCRKILNA